MEIWGSGKEPGTHLLVDLSIGSAMRVGLVKAFAASIYIQRLQRLQQCRFMECEKQQDMDEEDLEPHMEALKLVGTWDNNAAQACASGSSFNLSLRRGSLNVIHTGCKFLPRQLVLPRMTKLFTRLQQGQSRAMQETCLSATCHHLPCVIPSCLGTFMNSLCNSVCATRGWVLGSAIG